MKLNYKQVLPFCMLLSLGFGACSSDDAIIEDEIQVEETQKEFSKLVFNLGAEQGDHQSALTRALTGTQLGNWEDGWTYVSPSDPAPSQVYPLNVIYVFCRQASDEPWAASQDIEVLKYNLDEEKSFAMEYLAEGDVMTLKGITGKIKSIGPKGLDMIFVSQPNNVFETPIHPYLTTPAGKQVLAPSGDVLFRSKEYTIKSKNSKIIIKETGDEEPQPGQENVFDKNKLTMFRGTCSYNSKLIITDKRYEDALREVQKVVSDEDLEQMTEEEKKHRCWCFEFIEKIRHYIRFGCCKKHGVSDSQLVAKMTEEEADEKLRSYKGYLILNDFLSLTETSSLDDWTISTFIAPSRTEVGAQYPFPNKYNFFFYKPADKLVCGQPIFDKEGGIVALTKKERAFVDDLNYPGYPYDYKEFTPEKPVDFTGVGKTFNFEKSPFIYPFFIDGTYDLCFSIKQKVRGGYKHATLRFNIKNAELSQPLNKEAGPTSSYSERLITANRNVYTTVIIDVMDFVEQWERNSSFVETPRGASLEVVDLDNNVLNVPYKMF